MTARDVILTLRYLFAVRGAPRHLRSDNGPEFIAEESRRWLDRASVGTLYIQKAGPWDNGYVENFSGKLRDRLADAGRPCSHLERRAGRGGPGGFAGRFSGGGASLPANRPARQQKPILSQGLI